MATTKPRITITLTKRQHEVLQSIAASGGSTMSGMLGEFIELSMPTFERMAATFQQIKQANDKEKARIVAALDDAQTAIEPIALAAVGQFDLFLGNIGVAAGAATGADVGRAGGAAAATPSPPTNRGVTPIRGKSPQPSTAKASKAVSQKKVLKKVGGK